MGDVQEHGVGDAGHQGPEAGLDKGSDGLPSVPVHQPALLMTVPCTHCLWRDQVEGKRGKKGCTVILLYYFVVVSITYEANMQDSRMPVDAIFPSKMQ